MRFNKTKWAAGLALLVPAAVWADDAPTQTTITVTATRIATPAANVPAGVTVIDAKEIKDRGYATLVDALTAVPGLGVVQSGGPGTQASVFIRGTNSEDVLVLLDGVPVNDPSEANGAFNFGTVTLSDVARIEVIRGPMSGLYGSNAIGGVINIVTVRGAGKPAVEISAAGGWPAQGQGSVQVSGASGAFDYAVTGALDEEAGFDQTARRLSVYDGVRDPFRSKMGSAQFGYSPVAGTRISLVLRAENTDAAFPDLGYPIYDDPTEFDHNTSYFGRLGVSSVLFDGALTTDIFVARLQSTLRYQNLLDAADPNQVQADDVYQGNRTDVQWNNNLHLPDAGAATLSSVLFGIEYSDDSSHENVNENDFGSPFTETVHASQHTVAGHAGVQTTIAERFTVTAAVRDDSVSSFGNALTGRVGGVLAVPEADMRLKASYGTGFLAPSLFDLYGVDNFGYVGNPNLRPEYSSGYEIGPEFTVPGFGQDEFADLSITYFSSAIRDLITSTPDFSSEENVGRANLEGVESDLALTPADWARADLSYTYTKAVDAQTNAPLLRRPQNSGSIVLTLGPVHGVTVTPQLQFVGRFADYLYDNNGYPTGDGYARPGTIFNLSARYAVSDRIALFANGKNLFASKFEPVNGLQIPGASLLLGVQAKLR
jgi:vitamin B12 transporter